jgi:hypothetical protein
MQCVFLDACCECVYVGCTLLCQGVAEPCLRELLGEAACIREVGWWTDPQRDKKVKVRVFGRETKQGDMVRKFRCAYVYMR